MTTSKAKARKGKVARMHFRCPSCGPHVKADEDGCCAACGRDCKAEKCCPATRVQRGRDAWALRVAVGLAIRSWMLEHSRELGKIKVSTLLELDRLAMSAQLAKIKEER